MRNAGDGNKKQYEQQRMQNWTARGHSDSEHYHCRNCHFIVGNRLAAFDAVDWPTDESRSAEKPLRWTKTACKNPQAETVQLHTQWHELCKIKTYFWSRFEKNEALMTRLFSKLRSWMCRYLEMSMDIQGIREWHQQFSDERERSPDVDAWVGGGVLMSCGWQLGPRLARRDSGVRPSISVTAFASTSFTQVTKSANTSQQIPLKNLHSAVKKSAFHFVISACFLPR